MNDQGTVRVGLIGAGWVAPRHLRAFRLTDFSEVVAVAASGPASAQRFAFEHEIETWHADYHELLSRDDIDAVVICTPPYSHCSIVLDACAAGKHILVEKPLALARADSEKMISAVARAGVKLMVAYMFRFAPLICRAKEWIEQGRLGVPRMAYHRMFIPARAGGEGRAQWALDETQSGGMIVEMLTHGFDLFSWFFGPVETVYASGSSQHKGSFIDCAAVLMQFSQPDVVATVEGSWISPASFPGGRIEVIGSEGALYLDRGSFAHRYVELTFCSGEAKEVHRGESIGFNELANSFVQSILQDLPVLKATADDGKVALQVALAARQSMCDVRPVLVSSRSRGSRDRPAGKGYSATRGLRSD